MNEFTFGWGIWDHCSTLTSTVFAACANIGSQSWVLYLLNKLTLSCEAGCFMSCLQMCLQATFRCLLALGFNAFATYCPFWVLLFYWAPIYWDCQVSCDIERHCECLNVILCVGYRGVITTVVLHTSLSHNIFPVLLASRGTQHVFCHTYRRLTFFHPRHPKLSTEKDFNTILTCHTYHETLISLRMNWYATSNYFAFSSLLSFSEIT